MAKTSAKKIECQHCTLTFIKNSHFKTHMKLVHEGAKDFTCEECSKKFGRKDYLNHTLKQSILSKKITYAKNVLESLVKNI